MPIDPNTYYGTVAEADEYFGNRLHETDWSTAIESMKEKALLAATWDIDRLRFAGMKKAAYDAAVAAGGTNYRYISADGSTLGSDASPDDLRPVAATQSLEFPRDAQADVPDDIKYATFEIAHERLRGRDPQIEYENLNLTSSGTGSTRESMNGSDMPNVHLANGIVSWSAWRWIQPYLGDNNSFNVIRV